MTALGTDTDIATLIGELPAEGCEHETHGVVHEFHADGNEQYVKLSSPCGCSNAVAIYCGKYVALINLLSWMPVMCNICGARFKHGEAFFPLGPVERYRR
jgi:hypothetical protein